LVIAGKAVAATNVERLVKIKDRAVEETRILNELEKQVKLNFQDFQALQKNFNKAMDDPDPSNGPR
ncbi:unnamed protein product, partial [Allacma fusca]